MRRSVPMPARGRAGGVYRTRPREPPWYRASRHRRLRHERPARWGVKGLDHLSRDLREPSARVRRPNVFLMGEDIGAFGGASSTEGLLAHAGEGRVIDTRFSDAGFWAPPRRGSRACGPWSRAVIRIHSNAYSTLPNTGPGALSRVLHCPMVVRGPTEATARRAVPLAEPEAAFLHTPGSRSATLTLGRKGMRSPSPTTTACSFRAQGLYRRGRDDAGGRTVCRSARRAGEGGRDCRS